MSDWYAQKLQYYRLGDDGKTPVKASLEDVELWNDLGTAVAQNEIVDPSSGARVLVSTVFLTIDQDFTGKKGEEPTLFETMIQGGELDGSQWRYKTWDQAMQGHNEAVASAMESIMKSAGRQGRQKSDDERKAVTVIVVPTAENLRRRGPRNL